MVGKTRSSAKKPREGRRGGAQEELADELKHDVDKFVENRNKVMLGEEEEEEEDPDQVDVIGLGEEDEEDDEDGDDEPNDLDLDDEDEAMGEGEESWGKDKNAYYDADEAEDSEAELEEEKEVNRLREKRNEMLQDDDFGGEEVASTDDEDEALGSVIDEKKTKDSQKKKKTSKKSKTRKEDEEVEDELSSFQPLVERVERDLDGLSEREKVELLENDAPELQSLLTDYKIFMAEMRDLLLPALQHCRASKSATPEGLSYLESKLELLSSYCSSVVFYLLLKVDGVPVKSHPVIDRLVEIRRLLDKLKPLDKKMLPQLEMAVGKGGGGGARLDALEEEEGESEEWDDWVEEEEGEEGNDDDDEEEEEDEEEMAAMVEAMRKKEKSQGGKGNGGKKRKKTEEEEEEEGEEEEEEDSRVVREEFRDEEFGLVFDQKQGSVDDDEEEEEEMSSKKMKKGLRSFDDFGDEDAAVDKDEDRSALNFLGKRSLKEYVENAARAKKAAKVQAIADSGERDVPRRDRHTLLQQHNARAAKKRQVEREEEEAREERDEASGKGAVAKNPLYDQVRDSKLLAKQERQQKYARAPKGYQPVHAIEEGERREAGQKITKNRGLVPHRSKEKKNPRVKHRIKYEKSKTKQRTSYYGKQERSDRGAYGGEATGIKANISRSRKL